tara:strand:+ start:914 stop:1342 length:429 start_codon:yes stop_codon:yes gene_type:complete
MILISHRGNLNGRTNQENKPDYIKKALYTGFDVEVDVWYVNNEYYLGHDSPQYKIEESFLQNANLWCHAKNIQALYQMKLNNSIHCFYHESDKVTLTSKGYIWTYPNNELTDKSICVLPETQNVKINNCAGICSDIIKEYYA